MNSDRKAGRGGSATGSSVRGRGSPEYLRRVAILAIGGVDTPGNTCLPREIAVAFPDDRQTLTWLVAPEADWRRLEAEGSASYRQASDLIGMGRGMPPTLVAHQLAEAVGDCAVYTGNWMLAQAWTKLLFSTIGRAEPPFEIRNLDRLIEEQGALPSECMGAVHVADGDVRRVARAATEAAWHAAHLLAVRRQVQNRTGRWPPAPRAKEPRSRSARPSPQHKQEPGS
ncbi:hypothetical protein JYK14_06740 [Siccirubricoccus sp. KC 17139]|uniref:Uncharacterized protein n=1 Tax=Siccirubricoccus soli TaxID=2899147 RepID=A0ABT1D1V2_9PROT|nr:hypothetical protein [Siccirubricoccus soli]MCO6415872.1 hypothetical protein [Siccirubricoccus soli]MCP2682004.1 hypothetical protein [Siccirubricoccus soli]